MKVTCGTGIQLASNKPLPLRHVGFNCASCEVL